jgi:hypothetical protein
MGYATLPFSADPPGSGEVSSARVAACECGDSSVPKDQSDWVFADAWELTAVAISHRPCSLTEMVGTADGINHAILLDVLCWSL